MSVAVTQDIVRKDAAESRIMWVELKYSEKKGKLYPGSIISNPTLNLNWPPTRRGYYPYWMKSVIELS